jgi:hypothetical protein
MPAFLARGCLGYPKRNAMFPNAAGELATGRVWETADLEKWAKATSRETEKGA